MTPDDRAKQVAQQIRDNTSWEQSTEQIVAAAIRAALEEAAETVLFNLSQLDHAGDEAAAIIRALANGGTK